MRSHSEGYQDKVKSNASDAPVPDSGHPVSRQKLQELERLRMLLDHSGDAMLWAELPSGKLIDMNLTARDLLSAGTLPVSEISLPDILSPSTWSSLRELGDNRTAKGERLLVLHDHFRCPSGPIIPVEMTIGRHDIDDRTYAVVVARDITDRERSERVLRQSEQRYRSIFESIEDVYYEITPDHVIAEVSPSVERLSGWTRQELIGKPSAEVYADLAERDRMMERLLADGSVYDYEVMMRDRHGREVPCSINARIEYDADGKPLRTRGTLRDISQRKQAERAVRESEAKHRALFDGASDAIFLLKGDRFVECNESSLRMFGRRRDEIIGCGPEVLSPPNQLDGNPSSECARRKHEAAMSGVPQQFEWLHTRKDGSTFCGEVSLNRVQIGDAVWLQAICRDVTERKRVEATLQYRSRFEQLISEVSTQFISMPTEKLDDGIIAALRQIVEFTGVTSGHLFQISDDRKTVVRTHLWVSDEILPGEDEEVRLDVSLTSWWFARLSRGEVTVVPSVDDMPEEASFERNALRLYRVRAIVEVPLTYQDRVIGSLGLASRETRQVWSADEISLLRMVGQVFSNALQRRYHHQERATLEAQLRQSQKMQAVGQLAGGVAHDFNNLLQVIDGYIEMAMETIPDGDPTRDSLLEVTKASGKATALVRQLLAFGRREGMHPQQLNLNDSVSDLLKMLRRVIGEHVQLDVNEGGDLRSALADPGQIEQILMNLCVNARDAMPEGGKITIQTQNVSLDAPFCQAHPWARQGEYVLLRVKDTGAGIPPELQDRIFEPFFTTKEVGKGTGLGLATVYAIVERHKGFIHLQSAPGTGTSFDIYLPALETTAVAQNPTVTRTESEVLGSGTILLAEDDDLVRELTLRLLRRFGYSVLIARDGDEAVELFHKNRSKIDLALLDVVMPGRGGREVYRAIRKVDPALPVLFCSGYAQDDPQQSPITDRLTDHIQKPFRPADLGRKVRDLLSQRATV